ncbi:MAG: hypothetical protein FWC53_00940 [Firmicutes bacterium]|nr:hypothetical protein [Bacillota bacterium]
MKERRDLRNLILPTSTMQEVLDTETESPARHAKTETVDLIFIDSEDSLRQLLLEDRKVAPTDYAKMQDAVVSGTYTNRLDEKTGIAWSLARTSISACYVGHDGNIMYCSHDIPNACLRPRIHLKLPSDISEQSKFKVLYNIQEVKDSQDNVLYHTLEFGEYTKTEISGKTRQILEQLYNGGNLKEELTATGIWATGNGSKFFNLFAGKHHPYFEYKRRDICTCCYRFKYWSRVGKS